MDLPEAHRRLSTLIFQGLAAGEKRARSELSPAMLYAVTLYAASGFRALSVAVNTREALNGTRAKHTQLDAGLLELLRGHPDLLARAAASSSPDPEVCACEWDYVYSDLPHADASRLIDDLYARFYELEWEAGAISDWLLDAVSGGIQDFAKSLPPGGNLLLGLQFSDPCVEETRIMERVSHLVNSPFWHAKVVVACNALRGMS